MSLINIHREQIINPHRQLTKSETTILQNALGQLNWVAGLPFPKISFKVSKKSTRIKKATITDLINVNNNIKNIKTTPCYMKYPTLDLNSLKILLFSYASFNSFNDGGMQGWYIIFVCYNNKNTAPLSWNSAKIKSIFQSILAPKTLQTAIR